MGSASSISYDCSPALANLAFGELVLNEYISKEDLDAITINTSNVSRSDLNRLLKLRQQLYMKRRIEMSKVSIPDTLPEFSVDDGSQILRLVCTNDVYEASTLAYYAAVRSEPEVYMRGIRADVTKGILAGDFLAPSCLSTFDIGIGMINCMNVSNIDYVCIGNHENDIDFDQLCVRILKDSNFKWINSNMKDFNLGQSSKLPPYEIIEIPEKGNLPARKIALLGLLNETITMPGSRFGVVCNVSETAVELYDQLKLEGVDCVIPITHQENTDDMNLAALKPWPLIIGGHDHDPFLEKCNETNCSVVKTGKDVFQVAICDLIWDSEGSNPRVDIKIVERKEMYRSEEVLNIAKDSEKILQVAKEIPIFDFPVNESFSSMNVRSQPSSLARHLCTLIRDKLEVQYCLLNAGCMRYEHDFSQQQMFTAFDLISLFFFNTEITIVLLPGKVIKNLLCESWSHFKGTGGYIQTDSGIPAHIINSEEATMKLLDGHIQEDEIYSVAMLAKG